MKSTRLSAVPLLPLAYTFALVLGLAAMYIGRSWQAGFSGADEPSHFLNAYFISNYLQAHFGSNPLASATEYYLHYPKISIGHWPPAYYGLLGLVFMVMPPVYPAIFAVNVLAASLPALGVAAALDRLAGRRAALAGVAVYMLAPLVIEGQILFMVDQPLAACLVAATAVWIAYAQRPTWPRAIGFAALAALAILIKGNGWVAVLIPAFHLLLTCRWRLLLSLRLWVAAALCALAVVPWYLVTAKIAADGFNYHAGVAYAARALLANLGFLVDNLSVAGVALAVLGAGAEWRARARDAGRWSLVAGLLALILATLTLQSLVPVDIVDRYMAPALPAVVVLAVLGALRLLGLVGQRHARWRYPAAVVIGAALVAPGVLHLAQRDPKADVAVSAAAALLNPGGTPAVTVVDGSAGYEGAMIAAAAVRDPALHAYMVRSSKLLADSNFMGSSYTLKFAGSAGVLGELQRLGVANVVLIRARDLPAFPHSQQLYAALNQPGSGFRLRASFAHRNRAGVTEIYQALAAPTPVIAAVRSMGLPAKVAPLGQLSPGA